MLTQCSSWGAVFCIVQPCLKVSLSAPRSLPLSRFTGAPPADGTPTYDSLKGESNPVGRIESKWANRIQLGESNPVGRNRIQLGEIESSWQNLRGAIGLPRSRREATTHKVPRHLQRARRLPCRPRVRGARRGAADGGGRRGGGRRAGRVDHGAPRPARLRGGRARRAACRGARGRLRRVCGARRRSVCVRGDLWAQKRSATTLLTPRSPGRRRRYTGALVSFGRFSFFWAPAFRTANLNQILVLIYLNYLIKKRRLRLGNWDWLQWVYIVFFPLVSVFPLVSTRTRHAAQLSEPLLFQMGSVS